MITKRAITEKIDEQGRVIERVTVEERETPDIGPWQVPIYPNPPQHIIDYGQYDRSHSTCSIDDVLRSVFQ